MAAGTDIFISYKREEQSLAEAYAAAFREQGFLVVTDLNIPPSTQFDDAIDTMIREVTLVVALWTPAAAGSDAVRNEAIEALKQNKYLGVIAKSVDPEALPLSLRHNQFVDVSDKPDAEAIAAVTKDVFARVQELRAEALAKATQDDALAEDMAFFSIVNAVGELSDYQTYLTRYPTGIYREEAQAKIAEITEQHALATDRALYKEINNIGGVDGYRHYLTQYPEGVFSDDARAKISEITRWTNRVGRYIGSPAGVISTLATTIGALATIYAILGPPLQGDTNADAQLTAENDRIDAEKSELETELAEANRTLDLLRQSGSEELAGMQAVNADLTSQLASKQTDLDKAIAAHADENALRIAEALEVQRLTAAQGTQQAELEDAKQRTQSLTTALAEAQAERDNLTRLLEDATQTATKLQDEIAGLKSSESSENAELTQKLDELIELRDFLLDEHQYEKQRAKSLSEQLTANTSGRRDLQARLASANKEVKRLAHELQTLKASRTAEPAINDAQRLREKALQEFGCENATGVMVQKKCRSLDTTQLYLQRTKNSDLTPLAALTNLIVLDLSGPVSDLAPLQGLSGLQSLWLGNTPVSDLAPLQGLNDLRVLLLNNTQVSDLAPLQGLSRLQTLNLDSTQVSDLPPLQRMSGLQTLNLNNTQVSDLAPLQGLSALRGLGLRSTQVSDLAPLVELKSLRNIYLRGADRLTDLTPLQKIDTLHSIELPDGTNAGFRQTDTPENRAAVQQAIRNWKP